MTYLEAIIQHFGLPAGRVFPHMGAHFGAVAILINLSPEDHCAIGRLMGDDVMQVAVPGKVETNDIVQRVDGDAPWLAAAEAARADGFVGGTPGREVQHVDAPDPEPAGIPPHVFLYKNMCTDLQRVAPLGIDDTNGQYAVAIDDLTDEQRAIPHVKAQLLQQSNMQSGAS